LAFLVFRLTGTAGEWAALGPVGRQLFQVPHLFRGVRPQSHHLTRFSSLVFLPSPTPFPQQNFKKAAAASYSNAKSVSKFPLNKDKKSGIKSVKNLVGEGKGVGKGKKPFAYAYRPDLVATATARFQKLKKVADIRNGKQKAARKATTRDSR